MKKFFRCVILSALFLALAACGQNNDTAVLYIYNWSEYIPKEVYDLFEEETGIHVTEAVFSSNEEMLAKLIASKGKTYDIVIASNYVLDAMKSQDLIRPLDITKLDNFKNLSDDFTGLDFDPENTYSVPYMATATLIAANTRQLEDLGVSIDSYKDLTDPALSNSIVAVDDCREIVGIALKALGLDPNSKDEETVFSSADFLNLLSKNIKLYDSDTPYAALVTDEAACGIVYNMDAAVAIEENPDITLCATDESMAMSIDSFVLCKKSQNEDMAMKFIDFILQPEIYKMCLEEYPCMCLNDEALKIMDDSYLKNPAANLSDEMKENAHLIEDVEDAAEFYDEAFSGMKY